jgi:hypothetical protein
MPFLSKFRGPLRRVAVVTTRRLVLIGLFVSCISVGSALVTTPAAAQTSRVEHGSFTFPVDDVDTNLCGFPISIQSQASIHFTLYSDAQGTPVRLIIHFSVADGTFSANGVSLRQGSNHNSTTILFDSSGNPVTATTVGLTTQVFLPGGGVVIEAGRLVEDALTGTVTFEAGKRLNPGSLEALCTALSG